MHLVYIVLKNWRPLPGTIVVRQVPTVVTVLGQILEGFLKDSESASVDASTAQRMGRLLQSMQVSFFTHSLFTTAKIRYQVYPTALYPKTLMQFYEQKGYTW